MFIFGETDPHIGLRNLNLAALACGNWIYVRNKKK